jgi:hypothetical protein
MKSVTKILATIAVVTFAAAGSAYAQDASQQAQDHAAHHPDANAAAKPESEGMGDMMGSMKMEDMHGMMHECMEKHKDGKMCDHEAMEKCAANMKKADCQKMMKQAKTQNKKDSTKK